MTDAEFLCEFAKALREHTPSDWPNSATRLEAIANKLAIYRDIFAEITAKAVPLCEDESDPEKITGYQLPVGPLHRAAGKTGFQMFNGEQHLAKAANKLQRMEEGVERMLGCFVTLQEQIKGEDRLSSGNRAAFATAEVILRAVLKD